MVRPAQRREAVAFVKAAFAMSERAACRALGVSRASQRYRSRRSEDEVLPRMRSLAATRPRAGYRTLGRLLRRERIHVNHKRVYPLHRSKGLSLRIERRRRRAASPRRELAAAYEARRPPDQANQRAFGRRFG